MGVTAENKVTDRLAALRADMEKNGIDAVLVLTDDFHGSEYVGEYFKCRKFITGFTGSAGTALILRDTAGLWTDGRYFLQAESQLEGTGITLFKMKEPGVPTATEFLEKHMKAGQILAVDGRTIPAGQGRDLEKLLAKAGAGLKEDRDMVGEIWEDRPALSCRPVWILDTAYAGMTAADKISALREKMRENNAACHLLTSLDDIAWLLNLRGDDVACNPVFLSYMMLTMDRAVLYAQKEAFSAEILAYLEKNGVTFAPYQAVYGEVAVLSEKDGPVLLDPDKVNYCLFKKIPADVKILEKPNPTTLMKAVKNPTEMENIRKAHIKDGVAMTRFIYWLKQNAGSGKISELSAAQELEKFRSLGEGYIGPSFEPIIAYAEHGAIIHYSATEETDVPLRAEKMVLCDTGGQYPEGTTDITRTVVLGPVSDKEKEFFTRVLRGHLNLANARFLKGCSGLNFDYLAREPLWEIGENYNHGTGHGVGFLLNVHEGPNSFHYCAYAGRRPDTVLEEGMVTSDEPGYYLPGAFGIRHENLLLCREDRKTEAGTFMAFEYLTLVPFDREGIIPEMMSEKEKRLLNAYHEKVRDTIGPLLEEPVRSWLEEQTRPV